MSQNKTVIQGLEPADSPSYNGGGGVNSGFYSRNAGPRPQQRGTYVPGMSEGQLVSAAPRNPNQTVVQPAMQPQASQPRRTSIQTGKPIAGFLYSVSRTGAGEFWPLQIGQNTIGQSENCDIVLPEGTVSQEHAVLVVRKMKNPEKVIASISDARSTNGTMLNGVSLGFTAEECKNGDIITIGENYELYLILVDAATLGLSVSKDFIAIEEETNAAPGMPETPAGYTRPESQFGPPPFGGGFVPGGGTVGFDGSVNNDKGGTIGM